MRRKLASGFPVWRPDGDALVVRLIAGRSTRREVAFPMGIPAPFVAVGSQAGWSIAADNIAAVHAVLAFNGRALFACAQGNASICIDGVRVSSPGWVPVPEGATLELGGARLAIVARRADDIADTIVDPPSVSGEESAPTRVVELQAPVSTRRVLTELGVPASTESSASGQATLAMEFRPATSEARQQPPAYGVDAFGTTRIVPVMPRATPPRTPPPSGPTLAGPRVARATTLAGPRVARATTLADPLGTTCLAPPMLRGPARALHMLSSSGTGPSHSLLEQRAGLHDRTPLSMTHDARPVEVDSKGEPHASASFSDGARRAYGPQLVSSAYPAGVWARDEVDRLGATRNPGLVLAWKTAWKASSHAKKAIALLLVPTLVAMLLASSSTASGSGRVFREAATSSPRPPSAPAPASSASASSPPTALPLGSTAGKDDPVAKERTPERRALDLAASGASVAAADEYAALARAHPEDPAFAEAARILRATHD